MSARGLAIAVHAVPTLLWAIIAYEFWRLRVVHRPRSTLYVLLPIATTLFAVHMVMHLIAELVASGAAGARIEPHGAFGLLTTAFMIAIAPLFRHIVLLLPARPVAPSRRWIEWTYGSALAVAAVYAALVAHGGGAGVADAIASAYVLGSLGAAVVDARRRTTRGGWLQGIGVTELRSPDMLLFAIALAGTALLLTALWTTGAPTLTGAAELSVHTLVATAFAVPFAVRMLGRVMRSFLLWSILLAASAALFFAVPAIARSLGSATDARLIDLAAFALLLLVLVPGRTLVRGAIDRVLFRQSAERHAELQRIAASLSPADGLEGCIRRALGDLNRVMQFEGSAVLLTRGRGAFATGEIDLAALAASWPTDRVAERIPPRPLMEVDLRDLPPELHETLVRAQVVRLAPIGSPRQRWGHLFATEPLLARPISETDLDALAAFLSQLALVLDGCELLERAVAVERSLAHAEKLAAIGELAARVAHEIRNPITAARSLAQLLARDPTAPANTEHAEIILTELERVERQIASLLRFARREEFDLAPVDLRDVVRSAVADLRPALERAGIDLRLDLDGPAIARADAEKLRQVLINLVENAHDAVAERADGARTIAIALRADESRVRLRVADSGGGIPSDVLPQIFQPFFSRKPHGTGLGLAIVKRTIEAHEGRVGASNAGDGAVFDVDLPLARNA